MKLCWIWDASLIKSTSQVRSGMDMFIVEKPDPQQPSGKRATQNYGKCLMGKFATNGNFQYLCNKLPEGILLDPKCPMLPIPSQIPLHIPGSKPAG